MAFNFLQKPGTTYSEYLVALNRISQGSLDGLTLTHLPTIAAGSLGLFTIGLNESRLWIRPENVSGKYSFSTANFMIRYAVSQLIPSLIPETQPASIIADRAGLPSKYIYTCSDILQQAKPKRYVRYIRSVSIRCALAGSILLSQVISLVNIVMDAQGEYVDRIWSGEEPPLAVNFKDVYGGLDDYSNLALTLNASRIPGQGLQGVVVRLAGETSDVTLQSMGLEGRKRIFPVFEDPTISCVKNIVREYGCGPSSSVGADPLIPVYWRVRNGKYGRADSWRDLTIPAHWLSDVAPTTWRVRSRRPNRILVLEADATSGLSSELSLQRKKASELDLDLYEVEQGFHNLIRCVDAPHGSFDVMRVLLVDPEVVVEKGGGFSQSADEYVRELDLADVIIDARRPVTIAMAKWLDSVEDYFQDGVSVSRGNILRFVRGKWANLLGRNLRPVILWTPNDNWFQSIRSELVPLGYDVICYPEAKRRYGSDAAENLPMFVYENSIADSVHTTNRLIEAGRTCKNTVCSLFPQHFNKTRGEEEYQYASICSTSLYNRLFYWVRDRALQGWTTEEIQNKLDKDLEGVLAEAKLPYSHNLGKEALLALLNEACSQGDIDEAESLIRQGANPNVGDYDGRMAVHLAAASGQLSILKFLYYHHHVDLHCKDKFGNTPMSEAVRNHKTSAIKWLRQRGVTLETDNIELDIYDFCYEGDVKKLKQYIAAGCKVSHISDYDGRTPLMIAASFGHSEVIKVLLDAGADIASKDRWGQTALDAALTSQNNHCYKLMRGNRQQKRLVRKETQEKASDTQASRRGSSLKFMQQPRVPRTVIQDMLSAANQGNVDDLKRLVNKEGVTLANAKDYDARTPLHLAAAGGHLEAVKYLCSLPDININAMDRWHQTAAYEANKNGFLEISGYLRDHGASSILQNVGCTLCKAAAAGDVSKLEQILHHGSDLNTADYDGRTAAHLAASNGHLLTLKWLVSNGARVDVKDRFYNTPLDDAVREGHSEIVDFLDDSSEGTTDLHFEG